MSYNNKQQYEEKQLTCIGCGDMFPFTAGEQDYFAMRQLSAPKRCKACRAKKREQKEKEAAQANNGNAGAGSFEGRMY